ncbi:MAG: enoyl-CoA hydratase/isomerase family protein [Desulfobacterales bacterium]|jgi:cyclohexa-1,5-dienecarbonyl-CoA hydratase|nr:enoyl-CoA hydratase/isomerase family protein [Desulfobacterales bacterium]
MALKHITVAKDAGVARITFNRPKYNMLSIEMMKEIISVLGELAGDKELKCVVFLAEGRSWCAGVDVEDHKPELVDEMIATFNRLLKSMDEFELPTIAAVHGACLGGGMEVAIACDSIVAAKGASFGQPEIKLGFFPPYAAIRLPQLVGPAKTVEVCTTGKRYSAKEARHMGFVSTVVDDETFKEELDKFIGEITANSPLIIRLNKRAVKQCLGLPFDKAVQQVSDLFLKTLMKTEDTQEGMASYFEKRRPVWKNK